MAEPTEVIRQQMEETRAAMSEKVEALEKQVGETVKDTAQTVAETVHAASETIDKTVSTVSETVQAVTETFNISGHVEKHPWAAFGTAVALGYLVGSLIPSGRSSSQPVQPAAPPQPAAPEARDEAAPQGPGLFDLFGQLKGLAIGTAVGVFGEVLLNAVPQGMRAGLSDLVKDVTRFLGGDPRQVGEGNPHSGTSVAE